MAKLITESNFNVSINEDSKKNLYIEGVFASAETINANGRKYPRSVLQREYEKLMESVNQKSCMGELGHPTDRSEVDLSKSAILVEDMSWKGNDIHGKAKVLSTPYGQITRSLINDGAAFGCSTRGLGTIDEKSGYVNEDYVWITEDIVHNASNPASRFINGVLEGKEFFLPTDINNTTQPSYQDIKQFLSENKINYDPIKISELVNEGYSLEQIKDIILRAQDEHVKRIYQVLESLKEE